MRMMKNNNNETVMVIGIDHGYGNMKTATRCFSSGVARYDKEPIFQNNLLVYNGMYYQIGEEHKEFCAEKTQDEDYYVLTLAAIARELDGKGMNRATVHIAAGLPLTWVATQKEDFQKYFLQNECVDFTFRNKDYHVEFAGADIYPQGFAAAFYRLQDFKGINMLVDIGNGTMNIMYINNSRPLEKKCFTEKYGTHQCVLAVSKGQNGKHEGYGVFLGNGIHYGSSVCNFTEWSLLPVIASIAAMIGGYTYSKSFRKTHPCTYGALLANLRSNNEI